ncbi:hypothetical protein OROMI_017694 [Orobanche minor]
MYKRRIRQKLSYSSTEQGSPVCGVTPPLTQPEIPTSNPNQCPSTSNPIQQSHPPLTQPAIPSTAPVPPLVPSTSHSFPRATTHISHPLSQPVPPPMPRPQQLPPPILQPEQSHHSGSLPPLLIHLLPVPQCSSRLNLHTQLNMDQRNTQHGKGNACVSMRHLRLTRLNRLNLCHLTCPAVSLSLNLPQQVHFRYSHCHTKQDCTVPVPGNLSPSKVMWTWKQKKTRGVVNGATLEDMLEKRNGKRLQFKWNPYRSWPEEYRRQFITYLGCLIRDRVTMMADSWSSVDDDSVDRVYNGLSVFFDIEDSGPLYDWMDKRSCRMFREWKHLLHKHYLQHDNKGREGTPSELKHREAEWAWLRTHFTSELFLRRSGANAINIKGMTDRHHAGSRPYNELFEEAELDGEQIPCVKVYEDTHPGQFDNIAKVKTSAYNFLLKRARELYPDTPDDELPLESVSVTDLEGQAQIMHDALPSKLGHYVKGMGEAGEGVIPKLRSSHCRAAPSLAALEMARRADDRASEAAKEAANAEEEAANAKKDAAEAKESVKLATEALAQGNQREAAITKQFNALQQQLAVIISASSSGVIASSQPSMNMMLAGLSTGSHESGGAAETGSGGSGGAATMDEG